MTEGSHQLPRLDEHIIGCLSEDEVLDFAAGRLTPSQRFAANLHVDECEACQALLSEAVRALATTSTAEVGDELAWSATFRPGTVVGQRYAIARFIARGGMGEVYEAFDQDLQERVALKTVTSTACDNPGAVRRLKAEVQLARRVSHPNVCRIYDFGTHVVSTTGTQTSFLTMEFVDGETLGQHVRRHGAFSVEAALSLARELLLGLRAAHDAGVLHRDFKSDNVMLRSDGGKLSPLILDFGLARALERRLEHSSSTHQGLVGTLAYIAPEQLEGHAYSTASDVYSFGVVWFELLTGALPFKSGASPARTTLDRLTLPAPAPSTKNPRVPRQLDAIVLGCLRRSPAERFQTAGDVLARLDGLNLTARSRIRPRAFAPFAVAAGLLGAAAYGSLGTQNRTRAAAVSGVGPRTPTPSVPVAEQPLPAAAVEKPVELAALAPRVERPSQRRLGPSRPAPAPPPNKPQVGPRSVESAAPALAPTVPSEPGWENPFGGTK